MSNLHKQIRLEGMPGLVVRFVDIIPDQTEREEFMQEVIEDLTNSNYHLYSLVYFSNTFYQSD